MCEVRWCSGRVPTHRRPQGPPRLGAPGQGQDIGEANEVTGSWRLLRRCNLRLNMIYMELMEYLSIYIYQIVIYYIYRLYILYIDILSYMYMV